MTIDTVFLQSYDSLVRRSKVEHEVSINTVSHRSGVGVKLVTRIPARIEMIAIRRLLVFEESGRICTVQASVLGRTRAEAEDRYAKFIPHWEEAVGALAIHAPSASPSQKN